MYRILCYGDSNTWGVNPVSGLRFAFGERWPGVMANELGAGFEIIEDGVNGRTVTGQEEYFSDALVDNFPLDAVIIFLGVNDLCLNPECPVNDVVRASSAFIRTLEKTSEDTGFVKPEMILISPVPLNNDEVPDGYYETETRKVLELGTQLGTLASAMKCGFINSGGIIKSSPIDGIHLEADAHRKLGSAAAEYLKAFLKIS